MYQQQSQIIEDTFVEIQCDSIYIIKKASHTCYQALGPELNPVCRQSAGD